MNIVNSIGMIYHISKEDLDGKVLEPRVPDNLWTQKGREDTVTPRVCFGLFIEGCLQGLQTTTIEETYNVYVNAHPVTFIVPTLEQVADQILTSEVWVTEPVKLRYYGKLIVKKRVDVCPVKSYMLGNEFVEVQSYNYEVIAEPTKNNNVILVSSDGTYEHHDHSYKLKLE